MNEKAEFAVKILKQYAKEKGNMVRGTSDISPLEEWLIIKLHETNDDYVLIEWPDSQELMDIEGFDENSYLSDSSSYFVRRGWFSEAIEVLSVNNLDDGNGDILKKSNTPPDIINEVFSDSIKAIRMGNLISQAAELLIQIETSDSLTEEELAILNSTNPVKAAEEYLKRKGKL